MSVLTILPTELYARDALAGLTTDPGFTMGNARAAAWLCQLAYEISDHDKMVGILDTWGASFVGDGLVSSLTSTPLPISRTEAFLAQRGGIRILAFAGTDPVSFADWVTDVRFQPDAMGIAAGFADAVRSTLPLVKALLANDLARPLCVTGHSLGGALAVTAASALAADGFDVTSVYTMGMPRPGYIAFKKQYDEALGDRTYRLVNAADVIPTVAPSEFGLRHVGRLLRCESGTRFDPTKLDRGVLSDEPAFVQSIVEAIRADLRRPWDRPARVLDVLRHSADPSRSPLGRSRSDFVGLMIETLPTPLRDHLPDRYIATLG